MGFIEGGTVSLTGDGKPNCPPNGLTLEEWLWERFGQEWIRTIEGVKPADLQSVPLHRRIRF
jgi:hypothetical protein